MRYLERVETEHPLQLNMAVGTHVPLHCTASGKLMLALMNSRLRAATLDRITLAKHTPKTLVDRARLEQELAIIQKQRVGIDQEEFVLGMVAVAVPVFDDKGDMIAALACHGPTARVSIMSLRHTVPAMHEAADSMRKVLEASRETDN